MNVEGVHIDDGDVILIRTDMEQEEFERVAGEFHEKYPHSFIVWMPNDGDTFETMPEEALKGILEELLNHQEKRND